MSTINIALDMHNKHTHYAPADIQELIGFIPEFIAYALSRDDQLLHVSMLEAYQFGGSPMTGGTVHEDGRYSYPEDPDLYPIATFATARGIIHLYLHGITAICETGEKPVTYRFD